MVVEENRNMRTVSRVFGQINLCVCVCLILFLSFLFMHLALLIDYERFLKMFLNNFDLIVDYFFHLFGVFRS